MALEAPKPAPVAPAGQPVTPAPVPAPTAQPGAPQAAPGEGASQPVTKADLDAFAAQLERKIQSSIGKAENRTDKKIAELRQAGITATPQQAEALIAQEDQQQLAQPGAAPTAAPAQALDQAAPQLDPVHALAQQYMQEDKAVNPSPVDALAYLTMAKAGVKLVDEDPESIKIQEDIKNGVITDEDDFLAAVRDGVQTKKLRLERQGSPVRAPTIGGQGQPSNQPIHTGLSGSETIDLYFERNFKP